MPRMALKKLPLLPGIADAGFRTALVSQVLEAAEANRD